MSPLQEMAARIVMEQAVVIGPLAWSEAKKVEGLQVVDEKSGQVTISNGDPKVVIDRLVAQYERLFGRASQEVCREAVASMVAKMQPADVPSSLR